MKTETRIKNVLKIIKHMRKRGFVYCGKNTMLNYLCFANYNLKANVNLSFYHFEMKFSCGEKYEYNIRSLKAILGSI